MTEQYLKSLSLQKMRLDRKTYGYFKSFKNIGYFVEVLPEMGGWNAYLTKIRELNLKAEIPEGRLRNVIVTLNRLESDMKALIEKTDQSIDRIVKQLKN